MKRLSVLTSILLTTGFAAFATPVIPNYDAFGTFANATFGGSGIPNNAVASVTKIINGNDTIILALSATPRYSNPTLGNNGAGVFYATPGLNNGLTTPGHFSAGTWNFDFYFDATARGYTYKLFYGTDASSLVSFDPTLIGDNKGTSNIGGQNSENLSFGFGDPYLNAIWSFELVAYDSTGTQQLGETAINVDVRTVPDAASSVLLLGLGLGGLLLFGYRHNRLTVTK